MSKGITEYGKIRLAPADEVLEAKKVLKKTIWGGGLFARHIRFVAKAPGNKSYTCSCKMCQRHCGSLTQVWIEFASDQITWNGPGSAPAMWRSSDFSRRSFCATCGSTLGAIDDEPVIAIASGTFDSPNKKALKPSFHSHRSKRPKWWHV